MKTHELSASALAGKNTLKQFIKDFHPVITKYLKENNARALPEIPEMCLASSEIFEDITTREAKRVRAAFCYKTYKALGGENDEEALKLGVIIELIHAYLLVIDDYMDKSDQRRGGETAHMYFENNLKQKNFTHDSQHNAAALAVNTGLIWAHNALSFLSEIDTDFETFKKLNQVFNKNIEITGYGQFIDVYNGITQSASEQEVFKMLEWKTGVYTYKNPTHMGAILAGATEKDLEVLTNYSLPGGISFQVQDDILGMFGDPNETGKSAMDDLKEGKFTLLIQKALELGNETQKQYLLKQLGNRNVTVEEHANVKQIIEETGSLEYSRTTALNLAEKAKAALDVPETSTWIPEHKQYLKNIADFVVERQN